MYRQVSTVAVAVSLICLFSGPSAPVAAQDAAQINVPVPSMTILGSRQAESILGKEVRSNTGESLGHLVDIIVDRTGQVRAAVIDFGGFFGVGTRKIAVDWNVLTFTSDRDTSNPVTLELTREQIKAAPEYKDKSAVIVLGAADLPSPDPYQ